MAFRFLPTLRGLENRSLYITKEQTFTNAKAANLDPLKGPSRDRAGGKKPG